MHSPSHQHHQASTPALHREEVRRLLAPLVAGRQPEQVKLADALGRGLAADVLAPVDLPPFGNSQMDGFAVSSKDIPDDGALLRVSAAIPAGSAPAPLEPGTAAPIMTGAMLPDGADAVVPVERAEPDSFPAPGADATVRLPATAPGTYVRPAGSDIRAGQLALAAGTFLGPRQLGLLAALGITDVAVHRALTVLLITTGDEVVEPGHALAPGRIYDANATLLSAAMQQAGLRVIHPGIVRDQPGRLEEILMEHRDSVDVIVTSGGVSKGAYEVVRQALADHPVTFGHVSMQPGGPQGIGTVHGIPFLGFPGNPVSSLVSFEMFLRPVLSELLGAPQPRPAVRARLAADLASPAGRHQVRRGTLAPDGTVRLEGGEGSHLVHSLALSNALVHVPAGIEALTAGQEVEVWML
ncbi:gephyrin-like molybdotransferase Glp [Pseudarthrobacter sp. J75]|uniref:molybdopterin molybdotransferase MoeA n=1 Tax=unclassified Pseudarthrobacter TaxID=2647000 RepID=UPI002E8202D9|nr:MULTISPECIES: gephyrin-like molybdotransferase Glp [unclassified Pseudarthrobacter]MEE2521816.1 gephyrin-like molybdotransferase Glp [Pseudarthrobacter sp. J47]MEE2527893.1 gephyrin-like molybdotransferase Glp [Pseudarthrobacter sp. J75]